MDVSGGDAVVRRAYAARMDPASRREQILDATLRVISRQGVHKVSIDSVARQAGVARPVVYKHFEDAAAVLRASLEREERRAAEQYLDAIPERRAGMSDAEFALAMFENLLVMFESAPDLWRAVLVIADSMTSALHSRLEVGWALAAGRIEELLGGRLAGVDPDGVDGELLARMLLALVRESGRLLLSQPEAYPRQRLVASARQVLGLLPPG